MPNIFVMNNILNILNNRDNCNILINQIFLLGDKKNFFFNFYNFFMKN